MKIKLRVRDDEKVRLKVKEKLEISNIGGGDELYDKGFNDGYETGKLDGYGEGYGKGYDEGYEVGEEEGLAKRTYEIWTLTLADGSVIEKEVALL